MHMIRRAVVPCLLFTIVVDMVSLAHAQPATAPTDEGIERPSAPVTIRSDEGHVQISAPAGWAIQTDKWPGATISAADVTRQLFLQIYCDHRQDISDELTVERLFEDRREWLTSMLQRVQVGTIENFELNGKPALRVEIRGEQHAYKWIYIVTVFETAEHMNLAIAMVRPSRYERCKQELDRIAHSLTEAQR